MKKSLLVSIFFIINSLFVNAQVLPGFRPSGSFNEQQMVIENGSLGTRMLINAPLSGFGPGNQVLLVFYALPNGNNIEQTFGKKMQEGDDWHFDIQHIGAQTRFLRNILKKQTIVVVYLENKQKSWPAWKAVTPEYKPEVKKMVDDVKMLFSKWKPRVVLNGHSGGGRFIFSYLESVSEIPEDVVRIAFLDSDYGYEDTIHGAKITDWLKSGKDKHLCTLAYNDSVVIYNGKPLVSPTGGTWYRSKMMLSYLSGHFRFHKQDVDSLIWYKTRKGIAEFILKTNPEGKIFHTIQVERNGFIQSMLSGTRCEQKRYLYFGKRVYDELINDSINIPIRQLNIPPHTTGAEPGKAFMKRISLLPLKEREEEIFKAIASGNIPDFLRQMVTISYVGTDSAGRQYKITMEVMPDFLSVGNDQDFYRIPMNPLTAQRLADLFGTSLLTAKLSDTIYNRSPVKLSPFNYIPVGNANELVTKFMEHNEQIEKQWKEAGGTRGQLIAGIKKDVIISNRLAKQPGKVVIYGWHKPDGRPIQPVYSGHVDWYVDYSHGIRFVNNQVRIDGKPALLSDILKDPMLYKLVSDEDAPMKQTTYLTSQ
jgi:hypothetical protein